LWTGFGVERDPARDKLNTIFEFMREVICAEGQDKYHNLVWLCAWACQHPELPPEVILVLKSDAEGTGKNVFAELIVKIFGQHGAVFTKKEHLFGEHATYEGLRVAVLDEAVFAGDRQMGDLLKSTSTGKTLSVNPKYRDHRIILNHRWIIILSNHEFAVPAGHEARRYFVLDVSASRMQDFGYFQTLQNTIDNGGAEQFLDYLLTFDLADWHPRQIMKTPELNVQRQANLEVTHQYLYFVAETETIEVDRLKRYDLPEQGALFIPTTELYKAVGEYAKSRNKRLPPDNIVGMHLTKILGPSKRATRTANVNRRPGYYIPSAKELRDALNAKLKLNVIESERDERWEGEQREREDREKEQKQKEQRDAREKRERERKEELSIAASTVAEIIRRAQPGQGGQGGQGSEGG
jgi:hypothetical protein